MRMLRFGPFCLDLERRQLLRNETVVPLGNRAIDILCALVSAQGALVTKDELIERAWPGTTVEESNLTVQISSLRKALGDGISGQTYVVTVPGRGYRFIGLGVASSSSEPRERKDAAVADKPSIAVLPFANMSGDAAQEYFADGISEDIITALARHRWFSVIARNSSFVYKGRATDVKQVARELGVRYVLEGSVRRSAHRARITAQLVEATTGSHIWAERYDRELAEVFAIQDEIAERVAGAIEPELLRRESERTPERPAGSVRASDLVRRGVWYFHQLTAPTHLRALELFREATKLDPQSPEAHVWVGRAAIGISYYGWSDDVPALLREADDAATRAMQLDEKNPYPYFCLAIVHTFSGSGDQAIRFANKAIERNPSFALGHLGLGMALIYSGKAAEAIAPFERGLRLDPFDAQNSHWFRLLALAFHFSSKPDEALQAALRAVDLRPAWPLTLETLAVCYAALDRSEEAHDCAEQLRRLGRPKGDPINPLRRRNPQWAENIDTMLRKAGFS